MRSLQKAENKGLRTRRVITTLYELVDAVGSEVDDDRLVALAVSEILVATSVKAGKGRKVRIVKGERTAA